MTFIAAILLLTVVVLAVAYQALKGSLASTVFLWTLAFLLSGLYFLAISDFPFQFYATELVIVGLGTAVVGNVLLGVQLANLKQKFRIQGKMIAMKQNLLAIAAHELRTPITNLRSQADLAVAYVKNDAREDAAATLMMTLDDLDTLDHHVKAILALGALENGTLSPNQAWFPVRRMFDELKGQFAGKSNVSLIWDSCGDPKLKRLEIYSDYDLIKVVVRNAIENALKYTTDGYVRLSMEVHDGRVSITVRDTGIGMSTAEMDMLQWHKDPLIHGIRRGKDGWGIGMPVMKKFTEFLGGQIHIDSKPDFGTRLTITLPVEYRLGGRQPSDYQPAADPATTDDDGPVTAAVETDGQLKVLLIDDNETYLKQMRRVFSPSILGTDSIYLVTCDDPTVGITILEEQQYDLLLVDFHMPQIDGMKLLEWLNTSETPNDDIVKIMLTADPNIPETTRRAIVHAGARIVSKGMSIEDMKQLVMNVSWQKKRKQECQPRVG